MPPHWTSEPARKRPRAAAGGREAEAIRGAVSVLSGTRSTKLARRFRASRGRAALEGDSVESYSPSGSFEHQAAGLGWTDMLSHEGERTLRTPTALGWPWAERPPLSAQELTAGGARPVLRLVGTLQLHGLSLPRPGQVPWKEPVPVALVLAPGTAMPGVFPSSLAHREAVCAAAVRQLVVQRLCVNALVPLYCAVRSAAAVGTKSELAALGRADPDLAARLQEHAEGRGNNELTSLVALEDPAAKPLAEHHLQGGAGLWHDMRAAGVPAAALLELSGAGDLLALLLGLEKLAATHLARTSQGAALAAAWLRSIVQQAALWFHACGTAGLQWVGAWGLASVRALPVDGGGVDVRLRALATDTHTLAHLREQLFVHLQPSPAAPLNGGAPVRVAGAWLRFDPTLSLTKFPSALDAYLGLDPFGNLGLTFGVDGADPATGAARCAALANPPGARAMGVVTPLAVGRDGGTRNRAPLAPARRAGPGACDATNTARANPLEPWFWFLAQVAVAAPTLWDLARPQEAALGWFARPAEDVQRAVYFLLGDDDPASTPRAAGGAPASASAFPGLPDRRGLLPGSVAARDWYGAGGRQGSDLDAQQATGPVLMLAPPARPVPDDERRTLGLLCQGPPDRCRPCTPPPTVLAPLKALLATPPFAAGAPQHRAEAELRVDVLFADRPDLATLPADPALARCSGLPE